MQVITGRIEDLFGGSSAPESEPALPLMEAQVAELQDRWASYTKVHTFEPGQIVQEKRGLTTLKQSRKRAILFVRMLDPEDPVDRLLISQGVEHRRVNRLDCMTAFIPESEDEDGSVIFDLSDTHRLEPLD